MLTTKLIFGAVLMIPACAPLMAQGAPDNAAKPFDGSRYTLVLPKGPVQRVIVMPPTPGKLAFRIAPNSKLCAAVRVTRPNATIDSRMPSLDSHVREAFSKDLAETSVPAPSCLGQ